MMKEKITKEITIHRDLLHPNIVKFHGFFEDSVNIYIVLELCKKRVSIFSSIILANAYYNLCI